MLQKALSLFLLGQLDWSWFPWIVSVPLRSFRQWPSSPCSTIELEAVFLSSSLCRIEAAPSLYIIFNSDHGERRQYCTPCCAHSEQTCYKISTATRSAQQPDFPPKWTETNLEAGFHISSRRYEAQNYTMPALSPTMTEGNISRWNLKEGDSFTAGDVILEIETDKATMDVEAQEDGVLFKIMQPDGAKGVKVGSRIAVLAEAGDDLSSLEIPKDEAASSEKKETTPKEEAPTSEQKASPPKEQTSTSESRPADSGAEFTKPVAETPPEPPKGRSGKPRNESYPLYPSVQHLLGLNGMSSSDADQIPATGPNGRLLKGDVLAYLGKIPKDYSSEASERIEKLSHLDLSNITLAEPAKKPEAPRKAEAAPKIQLPSETEIAVPISLAAVIAVQKRVQDKLGIFLPLSTFVARASELANEDLPASKRKPTADDLFNSVLGLDKVGSSSSRGRYIPEITALSPVPPPVPRKAKKADIIDVLSAPKGRRAEVRPEDLPAALGVSAGDNIFSVTAKVGEEERVTEYLERLKLALEKEPGRLVL